MRASAESLSATNLRGVLEKSETSLRILQIPSPTSLVGEGAGGEGKKLLNRTNLIRQWNAERLQDIVRHQGIPLVVQMHPVRR